jgi:acetolactate synthase-1/2/3 large subunit
VIAALGFSQEYKLPIITVIMNNAGYLSMKLGITSLHRQGWAAKSNTFFGAAITPNPRYAEIAKAFDGYGETVEDPKEVEAALARAFAAERSGRSALLDIRLAPDVT